MFILLPRTCDHPVERAETVGRISLKNVDMIFRDPQIMASGERYRQQVDVNEEMARF